MSSSLADVLMAIFMWIVLILAAWLLISAIFRTARWLWKKPINERTATPITRPEVERELRLLDEAIQRLERRVEQLEKR